ncbi:hypothetical protein [Sphingomonas immobilis]|uniref:Uncharacterized protein n=1 Tax=Sphingomonas immobilis TaxID=3063997 RepID=A0ABT9A2R7_9SPHN|nr:hypothetical protein [Sphingomonas sp. CA1-15]MDO7843707.1 hypothetical protein [Sphingomonas sp. CA1-15]
MPEQVAVNVQNATNRGQGSPLVGIAVAIPISIALWAAIVEAVRLAFF